MTEADEGDEAGAMRCVFIYIYIHGEYIVIHEGLVVWWFGTSIFNVSIGNFVIPSDELIVFRC